MPLITHDTAPPERGAGGEAPATERILRAAALCFGRLGFQGASMSAIAKEAGVSKSLLHYHFDTKEHLFIEVQMELLRGLNDRIRDLGEGVATSVERLNMALDEVMDWMEQRLNALCILLELHIMARRKPSVAKRLAVSKQETTTIIVDGIRRILGPAGGELALSPERLAGILRIWFHGVLLELSAATEPGARADIRNALSDLRSILPRAIFAQSV